MIGEEDMSKEAESKRNERRRVTVLLTNDQFKKMEEARACFQQETGFEIGMSPFAAKAIEKGILA